MSSPVRTINILGATGSVGTAAADVIASDPSRFNVRAVTANSNAEKLAQAAIRLNVKCAVIAQDDQLGALQKHLAGTKIEARAGQTALLEIASEKVDLTLAAIVGIAGLRPILKAIENSKCVAIANKEPLVSAGPLIIEAAKKNKTILLPVDSEHNAIFQVFDFQHPQGIEKIILTASGGPFRTWSMDEMAKATPAQAVAHPNWSMGSKISVDSATMMNKALEIIEAHYLFNLQPEKIEVLIHPQSVMHSMVEYKDGSILAQMGASDMRTPLSHVLAWPQRMKTPGQKLDLKMLKRLDFEAPDLKRFPAIQLAYDALKAGQGACIALNAANEVAVEAFLSGRIGFLGIIECICHIMDKAENASFSTLEQIENYDSVVRRAVQAYMNHNSNPKMAIKQ